MTSGPGFDSAPPSLQIPPPGSGSPLVGAAEALSRFEGEIDDLWRESITVEDPEVSARLLELSRALQRAARSLDPLHRAIG
jgi:hypothetical protein